MKHDKADSGRRKFIEICVAGAAGSAACAAASADATADKAALPKPPAKSTTPLAARTYGRAKLVDQDGKAIKARSLKANHNYIFNYPYESTPCFLLNLGKAVSTSVKLATEAGNPYDWPGGVGSNQAIVAYSAICAHKLAYPTRQVSFIGFRAAASPVNARARSSPAAPTRVSTTRWPAPGYSAARRRNRWRPCCLNMTPQPTNCMPSVPWVRRNSMSFSRNTISN